MKQSPLYSGADRRVYTRTPGRRVVIGVLAVLVMAPVAVIAATGRAGAANTPYHETLPDLEIKVPTDLISIGTNPDTGHRQLQFTHITWDAGAGPFEIKPKFHRKTGVSTFTQVIFKSRGGTQWKRDFSVSVAQTGVFIAPSDYRFPLTQFTLNQVGAGGAPGARVRTSPKVDYCITADAFVGGVPNTPGQTSPPQSNCTHPNAALGLSVGWGDQYDQTDPGQPIDLTSVPDGTYILHAVVDPKHVFTESNRANDVTNTNITITGGTVTVNSQAGPNPHIATVALRAPRPGATVSGNLTLQAAVRDAHASPVASVQYLMDGQPLGPPVHAAPFAYTWAVGSTPAGSHDFSAQVTDAAGNMATAPVRAVLVRASSGSGTGAPTVRMINPANNQTLSGTVPVAVAAYDPVSIKEVQFLLDGKPMGSPVTSAPYALSWDTATAVSGPHALSAVVTGAGAVRASAAPVDVTVANPAPLVPCFVLDARSAGQGRGAVTTAPFHTAAAGEVLLAFVTADGPSHARQRATVHGDGLRWHLVRRADAAPGDVEVWTATAKKVLTHGTVTSTLARAGFAQHVIVIATQGTGGVGATSVTSGASGAPHGNVSTSADDSLVLAAVEAGAGAGRHLPAGWVAAGADSLGSGNAGWVQYTNDPTGDAGSPVHFADHAGGRAPWKAVVVELRSDDS